MGQWYKILGGIMSIEFCKLIERHERPKSKAYLLRLSKGMKLRVKDQAVRENKPMSYLIREMIDEGLDRRS